MVITEADRALWLQLEVLAPKAGAALAKALRHRTELGTQYPVKPLEFEVRKGGLRRERLQCTYSDNLIPSNDELAADNYDVSENLYSINNVLRKEAEDIFSQTRARASEPRPWEGKFQASHKGKVVLTITSTQTPNAANKLVISSNGKSITLEQRNDGSWKLAGGQAADRQTVNAFERATKLSEIIEQGINAELMRMDTDNDLIEWLSVSTDDLTGKQGRSTRKPLIF